MRLCRCLWLGLALAASGGASCAAVAAEAPETPDARYQAMLAVAQAGDRPVDWQALRFAYADRPGFNALDDGLDPIRAKMMAARGREDFAEVLVQAQRIIDRDYVDGEAHLMASIAHGVLRQRDDASRERAIALALFRSIETGDGTSPATAFTVISVREESELMAARRCRIVAQRRHQQGSHTYDAVDTTDKNGKAATFYFLIDRIVAARASPLRPGVGLQFR